MKVNKLVNNTYYIDALINIGVYKINENDCILIDVGLYGESYGEFVSLLEREDLKPKAIILTHCHADHVLGVNELVAKYGCKVYIPKIECDFIERPDLMGLFVYPSYPFDDLLRSNHKSTSYDYSFDNDEIHIDNTRFEVVDLGGHSPNMKGIVTPDNVLYAGDAYVGMDYLKKSKLLYAYNVKKNLATFNYLKSHNDFDCFIPSHGLPSRDISVDIEGNISFYQKLIVTLLEHIKEAKGMDEIMSHFIKGKNVTLNIPSYLITKGCLTSVLVYLESLGKLRVVFVEGVLKYEAAQQ